MKKLAIASALLSAVALTGTAAHAYQVEVGLVLMAHTTLIQLKHVMRHWPKQLSLIVQVM